VRRFIVWTLLGFEGAEDCREGVDAEVLDDRAAVSNR